MTEDTRHTELTRAFARELLLATFDLNEIRIGVPPKKELIARYLVQIDTLEELLKQQRRALKHLNGEQIEPQVHYGEAVIIGAGAGA